MAEVFIAKLVSLSNADKLDKISQNELPRPARSPFGESGLFLIQMEQHARGSQIEAEVLSGVL